MNVTCRLPIVNEPRVYIPQSGYKVTDGKDDDNEAQHSESIAHDDLPHDIVMILFRICGSLALFLEFLKLAFQLRFIVLFDNIVELAGLEKLKNLLQPEKFEEVKQL